MGVGWSRRPPGVTVRASSIAAQDTGPHALYWRFHDAVARAQLTSWLGHGSQRLIDISGPASQAASLAAATGHQVLHVMDPSDIDQGTPGQAGDTAAPRGDARRAGQGEPDSPRYRVVAADGSGLEFLADGCV